jgi:hypothetical protein
VRKCIFSSAPVATDLGEPASLENARWTDVVEKRDGRCVFVQQHFSVAAND